MTADRKPALALWAEWLLLQLIRFWPAETRPWGLAMAAEIAEIEDPWTALRWSLGGVMFFLRSMVSHLVAWMRLPAGVGLNTIPAPIGAPPPPAPKHSRLLTTLFFIAAALILALPQGREAITAVRASWSGPDMAGSDKHAIEALAAHAIREHDANQLAFAAISYPGLENSEKWSEQAVAMDASLSWIYASHATWGMRWEIPESHLRALREFDPENSFAYLLSADRIYRHIIFPLYDHGSPSQQQISQLLAGDPQWAMWMEKALQSTRYDNYELRRYELQHQVWSENRYLSPDVIAQSIESHAWPDTGNLMALAASRIQEAKEARMAGHTAAAEQSLKELVASSDRLIGTRPKDLILWALQIVRKKCLAELENLYNSTGRTQDAASVAARIAQEERAEFAFSSRRAHAFDTFFAPFRWKAYCVQISALVLIFFAIISALSLMFLEITGMLSHKNYSSLRKLSCFAADYAPILLLSAAASLLFSYRPFGQAFDTFRSGELAPTNRWDFLLLLYSLRFTSPTQFGNANAYPLWWAITLVLFGLALFILIRPLWKRGPAS